MWYQMVVGDGNASCGPINISASDPDRRCHSPRGHLRASSESEVEDKNNAC
uniref:Uncharacterized protein n=1 Tax=Setaria italica TaxID=4555 RepID=K3YBN2_SETIT